MLCLSRRIPGGGIDEVIMSSELFNNTPQSASHSQLRSSSSSQTSHEQAQRVSPNSLPPMVNTSQDRSKDSLRKWIIIASILFMLVAFVDLLVPKTKRRSFYGATAATQNSEEQLKESKETGSNAIIPSSTADLTFIDRHFCIGLATPQFCDPERRKPIKQVAEKPTPHRR